MLRDLLAAERGWIKATPREEVRNAISIVAERLCDNDAGGPRRDLPAPGREALRDALERVLAGHVRWRGVRGGQR